MSELARIQGKAAKEMENKRHSLQMRKITANHAKEYRKTVENNEAAITDLKEDYDKKIDQEGYKLEKELREIRKEYAERIRNENQRFEIQLSDLKSIHQDQLSELKEKQHKVIKDTREQQQEFIENARAQFAREKAKYES